MLSSYKICISDRWVRWQTAPAGERSGFTSFSFLPGGKAASGVSYYDLVKSNSRTWSLYKVKILINKTKTEATICDIIHQTK